MHHSTKLTDWSNRPLFSPPILLFRSTTDFTQSPTHSLAARKAEIPFANEPALAALAHRTARCPHEAILFFLCLYLYPRCCCCCCCRATTTHRRLRPRHRPRHRARPSRRSQQQHISCRYRARQGRALHSARSAHPAAAAVASARRPAGRRRGNRSRGAAAVAAAAAVTERTESETRAEG